MNYKQLGTSELNASTICFGCWAIGKWGWGSDVKDEDSIAAIQKALDLGINFFDTADVYGQGYSEELLVNALGSRRKDVIIATKVGNRWDENYRIWGDLSKDYILKSIDNSLKRLKTDVIDLYQVHRPDENTPIQETMETLLSCVEKGKIRYIGLSNQTPDQISEYLKYGQIVSVQPPLNLLYRFSEVQLLPFCQEKQIGVIPYSPLARGLLTGKFTMPVSFPSDDFRSSYFLFEEKTFQRNLPVIQALIKFAENNGRSISQLAVAWILAHSAVTSAIVGAKKPSQIEETAAAFDWHLSQDDLKAIDRILMTANY